MPSQPGELAVGTDELGRRDRIHAFATLLMRRGDLIGERIQRPRIVGRAFFWWARHDLELVDACGPLSMGGSKAVGARVAATDDDDPLAFSIDRWVGKVAGLHLVGEWQVFHRQVNTLHLASRNGEVAPSS